MKRLFLLILVVIPFLLQAQDKGLRFDEKSNWEQIKQKAKAENKYIFMDCFATWCGPCKYMTNTIFPQEEVGNFMNDKFISVAVQLDTTDNDNDYVKSWFKDGQEIANEYGVKAYPTYLIFNPDGEAVHRFVGSSPSAEFIEKVKAALNPETQYYTLVKKYTNGNKDPEFLKKLALASLKSYDMELAEKVGNEYLNSQTNLYTEENLELLQSLTNKSSDRGFKVLTENPEKVDAVLGQGKASEIVIPIIMREEVFKKLPRDGSKPDWEGISATVATKYPTQSDEVMAKSKLIYFRAMKDWSNYQTAVVYYMEKYGENLSAQELNSYAWTVFENCTDAKCIEAALEWSKRSLKDNPDPAYMDTYANLLYKNGNKDEAIKWEQKAIDMVSEGEKGDYLETLEKMKKGEKTWN